MATAPDWRFCFCEGCGDLCGTNRAKGSPLCKCGHPLPTQFLLGLPNPSQCVEYHAQALVAAREQGDRAGYERCYVRLARAVEHWREWAERGEYGLGRLLPVEAAERAAAVGEWRAERVTAALMRIMEVPGLARHVFHADQGALEAFYRSEASAQASVDRAALYPSEPYAL